MPKSKHRKGHTQKVAAFKSGIQLQKKKDEETRKKHFMQYLDEMYKKSEHHKDSELVETEEAVIDVENVVLDTTDVVENPDL